jgi:hypothetical protein
MMVRRHKPLSLPYMRTADRDKVVHAMQPSCATGCVMLKLAGSLLGVSCALC